MMEMTTQLKFPVKGDVAIACYFVKGNWPTPSTEPILESTGKHMVLILPLEARNVRNFQELLTQAMSIDSKMAQSARTLRMMLATQLAGKVIPDANRYPFLDSPSTNAG
jgi:hypothetical protein